MYNWVDKIFISLFVAIDNIIYSTVEQVYELFMLISEAGVFSQSTIQTFADRIYIFLGLIMIFVVSIAMVQFILDPKKFNDSKIGGPKLIKDFVFVLVGIILIPYIFEAAYKLQRIILKDNIIGNLILGIKFNDQGTQGQKDAKYYAEYGGKMMAYSTASAFITLNNEVASFTCINNPVTSAGEFNSAACGEDMKTIPFEAGKDEKGAEITKFYEYVEFVNRTKDYRNILNTDYITLVYESEENGDQNLMDYSYIISTIAGGALIYILLGFCIDIAVRSVKLGFLQLIAPVPLMMKIIPGSGQKKFDAWVKQCVSTYMDLFTRLVAIYFAVFIIAAITTDGIQNNGGSNFIDTTLVNVAIIFGALIFAAELPKLIGDIIGGSGGGFKLGGPIKKIMSSPYSGAVLGAAGGAALSTLANASQMGKKLKDINEDKNLSLGKKMFKNVGALASPFAGGISAGFRSGKAGYSGKAGLYQTATNAAAKASHARNRRDAGYGIGDSVNQEWSRIAGQKNSSGTFAKLDEEIETLNDENVKDTQIEKRLNEQFADKAAEYAIESGIDPNKLNGMFERLKDENKEFLGLTDNAQEEIENYRNSELDYEGIEKAVGDTANVLSEKMKSGNEEEIKKAKTKHDEASKNYKDNYEKIKTRREKFDEMVKLENVTVAYRNKSIKSQRQLDKAKSNRNKGQNDNNK